MQMHQVFGSLTRLTMHYILVVIVVLDCEVPTKSAYLYTVFKKTHRGREFARTILLEANQGSQTVSRK